MEECVFCELGEIKENMIYEDKICYVILEKFPGHKGESLVIAKKHYEDILTTPDPVVKHMFVIAKKVAANHKKKLNATGVKFIVNEGIKGVHLHILHFHIHVIPRYEETHGGPINEGQGSELSAKEISELTAKLKM